MSTFDMSLTTTEFANFIRDEIELLINRKARNCLVCEHFDIHSQECRLAGAIPPPRIAVVGCEKFEDQIPF